MKKKLLLIVIIIAAFILRFYHLGEVPHGFHRDEAYLGYNAYSILKTGRDMSGDFLPIHIKSFLYSPAGYSYFSIPFILLFGLSEFSVRFASALFGSLTIILIFIFTKKLFSKYNNREYIALLTTLFACVSPWHINLSRTATENTIVVFFIILGVILFQYWVSTKKNIFLYISFFSFLLTLVMYQAPRAFLPFFIPLMIITLAPYKLLKEKKIPIITLFILLILLPIFVILSSKDLSLRIRTVSMFSDQHTQLQVNEWISDDGVTQSNRVVTRIFHNKFLEYGKLFLDNYFLHFNYGHLFADKGFPDRYRVPGQGLLYIFEIPLLLLGIYSFIRNKEKIGLFIFGWVLFAPLGSALTFDDIPNLQRTLLIFPMFQILTAVGFIWIYEHSKNNYYKRIVVIGSSIVMIFFVLFYFHQYYHHVNRYRPWYRNDGYKELVSEVNNIKDKYSKVIITNRESAPTIFFLFYSKYDPYKFQQEVVQSSFKDLDRIGFASYTFSQEECPLMVKKENSTDDTSSSVPMITVTGERKVLYVNSGLCKDEKEFKNIANIHRGDGSTVFKLVEVN